MKMDAKTGKLLARSVAIFLMGYLAASAPNTSRAQDAALSATPEQLAARIAQTMRATNPSSPAIPLTQEIASHGNVVESRMIIKDALAFNKAEAQRSARQLALTRFMCRPERLAYMKKGVEFLYVTVGPDNSDISKFVIDERSCASIEKSADGDPATLTRLAEGVAQQLRTALSEEAARDGFRFEGATARDGSVQVVDVVTSPALIERFEHGRPEMHGITQGWFCGKVGDAAEKASRST